MQNWLKSTWRDLVLAAFVGLIIFIPRSTDLDRYVTIDEPAWLVYAGNFYYALGQRDWPGTYQREHPAVTLSWIGAAGFLAEFPDYRGLGQGQFDSFKKASLFYRDNGVPPIDLIATSRLMLVIVNSLVLTLTFWVLKRLVGRWPALLGFTLLAFSPFHIAHIQIFHTDALMGTFMFLALAAFLAYLLKGRNRSDLVIAGVATGLAWLTKAPSAILLPIFGLILLLHEANKLRNGQERPTVMWAWRQLVTPLGIIVILAGLVFVTLFPAMWTDPLGTISQMFSKVGFYSESGGTGLRIFFNGEVVSHERPSLFFYPITYLWRSTPVTLIGVLLSGLFLLPVFRRNSEENTSHTVVFIWLYLLVFTIWLTLPARMFDRYFHPFFGPAAFVAGVSWFALFRWLRAQSNLFMARYAGAALLLFVVSIQVISTTNVYPYYLSHYNQMLGGQEKAQDVMMIGWGDGLDLAADYLREQPNAEEARILTWYGTGSFSYFWFTEKTVTTLDMTWNEEYSNEYQNADYAIIYFQQIQREAPKTLLDFLNQHEPEHTISINGLDYIWIYNLKELPEPEFTSQ
ncbi:MAG: hypothetical protein DWQ07_14570 [Chloroflexi bacterium]|nr:MAG: hypothetical protein DWQ07_14570 [Chloroflexota bacterium]MBL1195693.1 hypothetical protein [Chloroflexota bacterium]NOH12981.1 hypothetical protein [Chloroflexota bacterium]